MSKPADSIISYIMFTTPPGSEPDWLLEVYVRSSNNRGEPINDKNVHIINRSGNIDSISPASEILHTYEIPGGGKILSYRVFHFNNRKYYGHAWIHAAHNDIDKLVFSNLTDQENDQVVIDIKTAITEVLL